MKPGMVWHKDQITFKIEYNVNWCQESEVYVDLYKH